MKKYMPIAWRELNDQIRVHSCDGCTYKSQRKKVMNRRCCVLKTTAPDDDDLSSVGRFALALAAANCRAMAAYSEDSLAIGSH